jgi:energy-coupling factor transport system permease protein
MSEFEYLKNIPFGQVIPGSSWLHRLDPRARILVFTMIFAALLFSTRPLGLLLGLSVVLTGLRLAHLPLRYTLRGLLSPLPFLLFLAVLQVLFNAVPDTAPVLYGLGPITITLGDLMAGVLLLLRFATLVLEISFSGQVLSISEMAHGLEALFAPLEKLRLPVHDTVMAVIVALRFLPFLAQSAERIAKAQASRGAEWTRGKGGPFRQVRAQLPLLVPIFITSLRRAETMALAMDARGYASRSNQSTSLIEMHWRNRDSLATLIGLALFVAILMV